MGGKRPGRLKSVSSFAAPRFVGVHEIRITAKPLAGMVLPHPRRATCQLEGVLEGFASNHWEVMLRPCSRAVCRHCGVQSGWFYLSGFGVSRRMHERQCASRISRETDTAEERPAQLPSGFDLEDASLCRNSFGLDEVHEFRSPPTSVVLPPDSPDAEPDSNDTPQESMAVSDIGAQSKGKAKRNGTQDAAALPVLPSFAVPVVFDFASVPDILRLCMAGRLTRQMRELAVHLLEMAKMAKKNRYRALMPCREPAGPAGPSERATKIHLLHKQRDSVKCLVEGLVTWRPYAPVMQLVQNVAADLSDPVLRVPAGELVKGLCRWGDGHVRTCIAKQLLLLMKMPGHRDLACEFLALCRYDLGRFQNSIVNELLLAIQDGERFQLTFLGWLLHFVPSPGKMHPQAWLMLNKLLYCAPRQLPRELKPLARHLWVLLGSSWSKRTDAVDGNKYYALRGSWLLSTTTEHDNYMAVVRARYFQQIEANRTVLPRWRKNTC